MQLMQLMQETSLVVVFADDANLRQMKFIHVGIILGKMSSSSTVILFAYISWMASVMIERLVHDVSRAIKYSLIDQATADWYLNRWQRHHRWACKFIKRINECFGLILLVFVIVQSICFVTYSFFVCKDLIKVIKSGRLFASPLVAVVTAAHWMSPLLRIYIVSVVCNEIQSQVTGLLKELRKIQFNDNVLQIQVIEMSLISLVYHFLNF